MTSRERPVRPQPANFEVFVDTCLRVAAEKGVEPPPGLGDRHAWDEAYRDLVHRSNGHPGRSATRAAPVKEREARPLDVEPEIAKSHLTRRRMLLATPLVLALAGAGAVVPRWLRGPESSSADSAYSPLGRLLCPPLGRDNPVWSVAVGMLAGEPVAIVGRGDGTVQLWNPVTGRAHGDPLAAHDKPVYGIALNAPMAVSSSSDGTLRVWDLTTAPPKSTLLGDRLPAGINDVDLGGTTTAVSAADDRTVRVWNPTDPDRTGTPLGERGDTAVKSVAVGTAHGRTVAVTGSADGTVRLWDVDSGQDGRLLGAHQATVGTITIGTVRDKTLAVSGSEDGEVRTWDLTAPDPTGTPLGDPINNAVKSVAIGSVKGRTVTIAGSDDGALRVWDLTTGSRYGVGLTGPDNAAEAIAIGHVDDRTIVVTGHWDGSLWTWSL